jgi:acyl-CoA hydrolase
MLRVLTSPLTSPSSYAVLDRVTEHGAFELRARSSDERALGLIGIAHPAFREQLLAEARRLNLVG